MQTEKIQAFIENSTKIQEHLKRTALLLFSVNDSVLKAYGVSTYGELFDKIIASKNASTFHHLFQDNGDQTPDYDLYWQKECARSAYNKELSAMMDLIKNSEIIAEIYHFNQQ